MANFNCGSCDDLRTDAPNFVVNGLTNTEIASLKNNTGLNPSNSNDDCEDLNNMNDCLIGNMEEEVELYDVCDWKEYMKKFVNNAWTMFASIIAAICGIWAQIKSLWSKVNGYDEKLDAMCELIDALINPPLYKFGTLLNDYGDEHPSNRGGVIGVKSNVPVVIPMERSELSDPVWKAQSIGIYHGTQQMSKCSDGTCHLSQSVIRLSIKFEPFC